MTFDNEFSELKRWYLQQIRAEVYSEKTQEQIRAGKTLFKYLLTTNDDDLLQKFGIDNYFDERDVPRQEIVNIWKRACSDALDDSNVN